MYRFLNKRTGVVIEVPCPLVGPDWQEITDVKQTEEKPPKTATKKAVKKGAEKNG